MKIAVIGVGYVGLVSAACFSEFGHIVTCFDQDKKKIDDLNNISIPIHEPGLEQIVERNSKAKRLFFKHKINAEIANFEAIFITVGTPERKTGGGADLSFLFKVVEEIRPFLHDKQVIIIKSTVPVGTNREINKLLNTNRESYFPVVSNPEFLREGSAIEDFMKPDRVIVGLEHEAQKKVLSEIYKPLYLRDFPIVYTDPESAEITKYASNAFLATKISFINEIAVLCEKTGGNVKEVAKGMGLDRRIGNKFLHSGPGYGGSCFPKDTNELVEVGKKYGAPQRIVNTVMEVNEAVKERMVDLITESLDCNLSDKIVAFFGVTFKPNTDDIRSAPSLTIIPKLIDKCFKVRIVDPQGKKYGQKFFERADWYSDPYQAAKNADLLVILTEWNEFRAMDLSKLATNMKFPRLVDLRNVYSMNEAKGAGFLKYVSIGRDRGNN